MAGSVTQFEDINITPLTDIFLVLLIIMMVVAPMMQSVNKDIKLPAVSAAEQVKPGDNTVEVTAKGELLFAGKAITLEALGKTLKAKNAESLKTLQQAATNASGTEAAKAELATAKQEAPALLLRGDKEARAKMILPVFAAAREAGFSKVILAGDVEAQASGAAGSNPSQPSAEQASGNAFAEPKAPF